MKLRETALENRSAPDLLTCLREATRAEHEAVERALDFLHDGFTLPAYRRRLERFHGFYAPLEERLAARDAFAELDVRRKTPRLTADLRALGVAEPEHLPRCPSLPALAGRAEVLGCLYVIEGASLGGQVIARHLARTLGLGPDNGAGFFHGDADETGRRWRAFTARLLAFEGDAPQQDALVQTAIDTFRSLRVWCIVGDA